MPPKRNILGPSTRVWSWICVIGAVTFFGLRPASGQAQTSTNAKVTDLAQEKSESTILDAEWGVGSWIWADKATDKQNCRFWRAFEIPQSVPVTSAKLRITGDNAFRALLDGRELGRGSDWRSLTEYDVTQLLSAGGTHVLGVEAFNDRLEAGVLLGLRIELANGRVIEIGSDKNWRVVPESERGWETRKHAREDWPAAALVGTFGAAPWATKPYGVTKLPALQPMTVHFWQSAAFQITLLVVCGIAVLICLRLLVELTLQSKAEGLLQRERDRIARDIHDDVGAELTQLVLQGEVMKSELPAEAATRQQIDQLCERGRVLGRALDEVVWAVNSRRDTLRDFTSYVCKYAQTFLRSASIPCRLDVEIELPSVPFDLPIRRNLFLAVKEALNNAAKYSGATELFLRIHRQGDGLRVMVEDNGRGFDPALANSERNGLANMKERLGEVGGTCRLISMPGAGCRVEFEVPRLHVRARPWWLNWKRRHGRGPIHVAVPPPNVGTSHAPRTAET